MTGERSFPVLNQRGFVRQLELRPRRTAWRKGGGNYSYLSAGVSVGLVCWGIRVVRDSDCPENWWEVFP